MYICVCEAACQAMCDITTTLIVTKLSQQMLHITCLKLIPPHLRFEAFMRPKLRSKSRSKVPCINHITQTIDGRAMLKGQPLGNSCTVPALARAIYGKTRGKKVSRGGH